LKLDNARKFFSWTGVVNICEKDKNCLIGFENWPKKIVQKVLTKFDVIQAVPQSHRQILEEPSTHNIGCLFGKNPPLFLLRLFAGI